MSFLPLHSVFIIVASEAVVCHVVHPFAPIALLANVHAVSHWSSSRPLTSGISSVLGPHQDFSQISGCCPELWRSYGFWSADQSLHILQQLIDVVDVGVGQLKVLDLGLGDSSPVPMHLGPSLLHHPSEGQASSAQYLDINMASGRSPDQRYLHGLWW